MVYQSNVSIIKDNAIIAILYSVIENITPNIKHYMTVNLLLTFVSIFFGLLLYIWAIIFLKIHNLKFCIIKFKHILRFFAQQLGLTYQGENILNCIHSFCDYFKYVTSNQDLRTYLPILSFLIINWGLKHFKLT